MKRCVVAVFGLVATSPRKSLIVGECALHALPEGTSRGLRGLIG